MQVCRAAAASARQCYPPHADVTPSVSPECQLAQHGAVSDRVCATAKRTRGAMSEHMYVSRGAAFIPPSPRPSSLPPRAGPTTPVERAGRGCTVALLQAISGGCGRSGYESREDSGVMHQCRGGGPSRVQGLPHTVVDVPEHSSKSGSVLSSNCVTDLLFDVTPTY